MKPVRSAECEVRSEGNGESRPLRMSRCIYALDVLSEFLSRSSEPITTLFSLAFTPHSALNTPHSALIPILGIPACGMYHAITVLDLVLPRVLAGETIGRKELAELGHGGLCLHCQECRYPVCPFGK